MKVGDLVIHKYAPKGQGKIRLIIAFEKKPYAPVNNTQPFEKEAIIFENGMWDWMDDWRNLNWWDFHGER